MDRATVPEETANILLETMVRDKVQGALNGVFQSIKEMSGQATPARDQEVVRFALLNMVEKSFKEIMEKQRCRVLPNSLVGGRLKIDK